jgi:DDE superfamily endonuclease.
MTHEMLMRQVCLSACDVVNVLFLAEAFKALWNKFQTVDYGALVCSADGSRKLPPLVTGKCKSPGYFKAVKRTANKMQC